MSYCYRDSTGCVSRYYFYGQYQKNFPFLKYYNYRFKPLPHFDRKHHENIFKLKNASDKVFVLLTDKAISLERFDCRHAQLGPNDKISPKQNVWINGDKILPFDLIDISQAVASTLHYDFTIETLNEAIKQLDLLLVLLLESFCSANTDLTCSAVKLKSYELIKTSGS